MQAGLFRSGLNWNSAKAKFARRIVKITFFSKISDYIRQLCYTELWTCYSKELETLKFATKTSSDLHAGSVMPLWREFLRPEAYRPLGKNLWIRGLSLSINCGTLSAEFWANHAGVAGLDLGFSIITKANTTSDFKLSLYGTSLSGKPRSL